MSDAIIYKIESSAKIEVFIGLVITTLIGLLIQLIAETGIIYYEIVWVICIFIGFFFGLQGLYYLKFLIEKWVFLKEQKQQTEMQNMTLEVKLKELGLKKEIAVLQSKGITMDV